MTEKKDNLSFIILNNLELIEKDELLENSVKIEESVDNKTENMLDLEQKMKDFHKINWEDKLNIFNNACEVIYSTNHEEGEKEETLEK